MNLDALEQAKILLEQSQSLLKQQGEVGTVPVDAYRAQADALQLVIQKLDRLTLQEHDTEERLRTAFRLVDELKIQLETSHNALDAEAERLDEIVQEKTKELAFEKDKLARLVELGVSLSQEKNAVSLMSLILDGAKSMSNADGGTLYVRTPQDTLKFSILRNDSLGISLGGVDEPEASLPDVRLYDDAGELNTHNVASTAVNNGQTVNIPDAYDDTAFDFSGTKMFDEANNYRSKSFLTVPLRPRGGNVIGALQLINALDHETGEVVEFSPEIQEFVELLSAQAAVALENQQLFEAQKALMDSFIKVIAGAIDAKSPYTGGHCERVPELGIMLTEAASASSDPMFADFSFETEDEWREFRIGAWLHDCGKVTTPEYVVDKATKLETIYNRIHEIRMRFEVLRRDAEIDYLKACAQPNADQNALKQRFEETVTRLEDDFAFIAECNVGGEFMADEKIERLEQLSELEWTRFFDSSLGLSIEERHRLEQEPTLQTPAREKLLSDRPSHIHKRTVNPEPVFREKGFTMKVPEHLYNSGELHNLRIKRGTLNDEERFKINEHIIQTIVMLDEMPFPKHLAKVPYFAGTHHEKMDGTGYPRSLGEEDLDIPARIMALADVFEALTASDRPYKEPKMLSDAVKILSFMVKDRHIDADCFRLFLTSGVYLDYANRYLPESQIDEVDIAGYLAKLEH